MSSVCTNPRTSKHSNPSYRPPEESPASERDVNPPPDSAVLTFSRSEAEIARLRREKAELEGKTSPSIVNRAPPPHIGLGSGQLFPQLTPGVREGKPIPGSQPHDPYINGGAYGDGQSIKRGRPDDPYSSRGILVPTSTSLTWHRSLSP